MMIQAALAIEDRDVTMLEAAQEIARAVNPADPQVEAVQADVGLWLVNVPDALWELLEREGSLDLTFGAYSIRAEMP